MVEVVERMGPHGNCGSVWRCAYAYANTDANADTHTYAHTDTHTHTFANGE